MADAVERNGCWIRELLDLYEQPLLRFARRLLGDDAAAQDVVQETFLRLCRTPPEDVDGHAGPWLYRVCRQRATDRLRKEGRMAMLDERVAAAATSDVATPDEQVASLESTSEVRRLVAALPPRQQEALRLKFEHGLKYREIADVMGLSATNVGFLLHTALATLRAQLAEHQAEA